MFQNQLTLKIREESLDQIIQTKNREKNNFLFQHDNFIFINFSIGFGIMKTMVNLKYETKISDDCILLISGEDLCLTIQIMKTSTIFCVIIIIGFIENAI